MFTQKYRKKVLYGHIRKDLKEVFHRLARQKECLIEEGYLKCDHVHMLISIPPKYSVSTVIYSVSTVIGFLKGKSSIWIAQTISNRQRNFVVHKFWARGYFVSTVGADEKIIRAYIQNQEADDKRLEKFNLFDRL